MFGFNKKADQHRSDEELMQMICKGNRAAFESLYHRYFNKLVYFSKRILFDDQAVAEDLVQEVFIKIIDKPELFDKQRVFSTWVYTMTRNLCFNHTRNELNRKKLLDVNLQVKEHTHTQPKNDLHLLKHKINDVYKGLSEKEKLIFVLRFEHDLSIKEIAQIGDMPEGSVKSGIYYLLKKVAVQLKDFRYEYK